MIAYKHKLVGETRKKGSKFQAAEQQLLWQDDSVARGESYRKPPGDEEVT